MRFFLDNDVDVVVATMLQRRGHVCWAAAGAVLEVSAERVKVRPPKWE
jgi:hypothetical protein